MSDRQAEVLGRGPAEPAVAPAQRDDPRRPLLEEVLEPDRAQQPERPAAVGPRVVPFDRDVVQRERPVAGQAMHHPVGALDDPCGRSIELGLVPLEPERLGQHPLGRDPAGDVPQDRVAGGADVVGLAEGALVHPEQCRAEGLPSSSQATTVQAVQSSPTAATSSGPTLGGFQGRPHRRIGPPTTRRPGPARPRSAGGRSSRSARRHTRPSGRGDRPAPPAGSACPRPGPAASRRRIVMSSGDRVVHGSYRSVDQNAFRLSSRSVTGPSLTSSTFIIARKTPVATSRPDCAISSAHRR